MREAQRRSQTEGEKKLARMVQTKLINAPQELLDEDGNEATCNTTNAFDGFASNGSLEGEEEGGEGGEGGEDGEDGEDGEEKEVRMPFDGRHRRGSGHVATLRLMDGNVQTTSEKRAHIDGVHIEGTTGGEEKV
jgi:hypothetical protein